MLKLDVLIVDILLLYWWRPSLLLVEFILKAFNHSIVEPDPSWGNLRLWLIVLIGKVIVLRYINRALNSWRLSEFLNNCLGQKTLLYLYLRGRGHPIKLLNPLAKQRTGTGCNISLSFNLLKAFLLLCVTHLYRFNVAEVFSGWEHRVIINNSFYTLMCLLHTGSSLMSILLIEFFEV
jgi:hypothetical protein